MEWLVAVIIDHDDPPRDVSLEPSSNAVVLLRRDWDFLFEQLKSTHGVARYLRRVAGEEAVLGDEPVRYYELAAADEEAPPKVLDPAHLLPGMKQIHEPLLPMAPAATEDEADHRLIRAILEDIASIKTQVMPEGMRVRALAYLDSLPTRQRAMAGQFLRDGFLEARQPNRPGGQRYRGCPRNATAGSQERLGYHDGHRRGMSRFNARTTGGVHRDVGQRDGLGSLRGFGQAGWAECAAGS
jgi:hypothetical protein